MAFTEIDLEIQSQDGSMTKEKLKADFLAGSDLNLSNGANDATIVGLKDAVDATSPATLAQLQAAIGINGNMVLKGAFDASALGSQLDDAEAGFWYKVTVAGTVFAGSNPIQLDVGDNIYCQNTVVGTPTDGADFFKVDNTESADLLKIADIVNDLTTGGVNKVLSAQQGVVLKGFIDSLQTELDDTQAGAGLGADGSYTANGGANYISGATSLKSADDLLDAAIKVNADAIAGLPTDVYGEKPAITVGSPVLGALANTPIVGTVRVYWNGLRAEEGAGNDYTISGGVITMGANMKVKDKIIVDYKH